MPTIGLKKTLSLHKYSIRVKEILLNWKFILPLLFSVCGIAFGCVFSKGQGAGYLKIADVFSTVCMFTKNETIISEFLKYLLIPTVFAATLFFIGLCVFGGLIANVIPMAYGFLIGVISYYLYYTYVLKGLAYCVILIFPYAVISLFAIISCCRESINMSELLLKTLAKNMKFYDYNFKIYYKNYLKSYVYILIAAIVKVLMNYLFVDLFVF